MIESQISGGTIRWNYLNVLYLHQKHGVFFSETTVLNRATMIRLITILADANPSRGNPETDFAVREIQLELAQPQPVVGTGDGFGRCGAATLGHQQRRASYDLEQIGLRLDARRDPVHGDLSAQIQANRLTIAGRVADSPLVQQFHQFFVGSRHKTSPFLSLRSPVFASVQPVLLLCSLAV